MKSFAAIIERPPSIYSDSSTDPTHPTREFPPSAAATESPLEYVDPFFSTNLPLSPRVRTDSVTSSVSSFQSSYLEGFSPDTSASTYYPAREPVTTTSRLTIDRSGRGFVVETSVSGVASAIVVEWDQLVQLLVNRESVLLSSCVIAFQLIRDESESTSRDSVDRLARASDRSSECTFGL